MPCFSIFSYSCFVSLSVPRLFMDIWSNETRQCDHNMILDMNPRTQVFVAVLKDFNIILHNNCKLLTIKAMPRIPDSSSECVENCTMYYTLYKVLMVNCLCKIKVKMCKGLIIYSFCLNYYLKCLLTSIKQTE